MIPIDLTLRALERRLKRYFLKNDHQFFAACAPGLETVLLREVQALEDCQTAELTPGGVEFSGPLKLVYAANLKLRTANKVLLRIFDFSARSYPELYNKTRTKRWEVIVGRSGRIAFEITSRQSRLHHTDNMAKAVLDGINTYYEPFALKIQRDDKATLRIFIRAVEDHFTFSVDTSGELLHKRGYKTRTVLAPLRETLSSGVLQHLDLARYPVILDPCCGSGTLIFEAAALLTNSYPSLNRSYALEKLPFFNADFWEKLKQKITATRVPSSVCLIGSDIDPDAIAAASQNQSDLGIPADLQFNAADALELKNSWGKKGLIVTNLPYGVRLKKESASLDKFYTQLGQHLKKEFSGWDALLLSNGSQLGKKLDLKLTNLAQLNNNGIEIFISQGRL